ncbi:hypothetical protein IFM89_027156, partial [Coptis chinensis]
DDESSGGLITHSQSYHPASLPNPPAGFVLDPNGKVVLVSSKRIVTIVDSTNNLPLECVIRRVFRSSQGDDYSVTQQGEGSAIQKRMFSNLAQMRATHLGCLEVLVEILTEHYGVPVDKIDIITASMGYALATDGGFCTGSVRVVDHQDSLEIPCCKPVIILDQLFLFL